MLKDIKIGSKLVGAFILVACIAALIGIIAYIGFGNLTNSFKEVTENRLPSVKTLTEIEASCNAIMVGERGLLNERIFEDDILRQAQYEYIDANWKALDEAWNIYEPLPQTTEETALWKTFVVAFDNWKKEHQKVVDLCRQKEKLHAKNANEKTIADIDNQIFELSLSARKYYLEVNSKIQQLVQLNMSIAESAHKAADAITGRTEAIMLVAVIIGVVAAILMGIFLSRSITGPLYKTVNMMQEMGKGHLSERIHIDRKDEIGILSCAMDEFAENLQKYVVKGMQQISEGNINIETPVMDDKDEIGPALKKMVENLKKLIVDFNQMYEIQKNGDFEYYMNVSNYTGAYKQVAEGYNEAVRLHVGNILKILGILSSYAEGDFNPVLEKLPGKQIIANEKMDTLRANLQNLIKETTTLTKTASNGNLSVRADINKFGGDFTKIITGINDIMDAVIIPVNEAASVMEKVASNDLSVRVKGDYKGDLLKIKDSINTAVMNLDKAMQQVAIGAEQVASASVQVSTGGQALSQGTSEQASSLEEVSSSLQEMSSMTKQNTANAKEAKGVADQTRESSEKGVESMSRLSSAINKIKASSDSTAKIVKTIDEIAFQTNLLALNAAVEAARAGDAGKGFAVVAEEVRNLAMRSAEAAKTTANLIEDAVKNSENGVAINAEVLKNFQEINERTNKVSQVVAEIAAASEQQDQGIGQVNKAVEQMNQVTQQNAANAEESASAAEEMSSQSEEMRSMVQGFKLTSSSDFNQALRASSQSGHMLHNLAMGKKGGKAAAGIQPDPRKIIPLDEKDHNILKTF